MKKNVVTDQPILLNQLVESLGQAAGGASQLIHTIRDPRFIVIREAIELAKEGVLQLATFQARKVTYIKPS